MKYIYGILIIFLSLNIQAKEYQFGEEVDEAQLVTISKILSQPEAFLEQPVTISGTVIGVCEKRGCWMELASDVRYEKLRIKVRDGDMVFPVSTKGSKAIATGLLSAINLDLEQSKRYLAMLAKRKQQEFDPASVTEALTLYQLVPTGVKILD